MAQYTDDELARIRVFVAEQAQIWADDYVGRSGADLRRRKIEAKGELIREFFSEVVASNQKEAVEILMGFPDHGRYIDMRTMKPAKGGEGYINSLVEWIKDKGLEQQFTERYMERRKVKKVPERVLVYIAWGIASQRSEKYKRKAWWNKRKSAAITDLYNTVAAGLPDVVAGQITDQLKDGSKKG